MASPLRLTIARGDLPDDVACVAADAAWTIVRATFEVAEATMSRFQEESELTGLNRRSPGAAPISRPLERALSAADRARRMTGGRFDPRVIEALERIRYLGVAQARTETDASPGRVRGNGRIFERRGRTGHVAVPRPVDLGGIGKGLALRWAANALDASVVGTGDPRIGYLIDAGGDIVASGSPGGEAPWLVAIEDPSGEPGDQVGAPGAPGGAPEPVAVVAIRDRAAVATSSIRRLRWQHDGRTVHHLIDPRTGEPGGDGLASVTVAASDPAWAEVWSKALFLEGADRITALARARGLAAWWVATGGRLEMTAAARLETAWVAGEAARS